jgi:hypothetical protein
MAHGPKTLDEKNHVGLFQPTVVYVTTVHVECAQQELCFLEVATHHTPQVQNTSFSMKQAALQN